jgi:hypothetical protein
MAETINTTLQCTEGLKAIEELSFDCMLMSDAALFEDVGLSGIPFLSGSCRGFGFDMTDEFPNRTNENSKPYVS